MNIDELYIKSRQFTISQQKMRREETLEVSLSYHIENGKCIFCRKTISSNNIRKHLVGMGCKIVYEQCYVCGVGTKNQDLHYRIEHLTQSTMELAQLRERHVSRFGEGLYEMCGYCNKPMMKSNMAKHVRTQHLPQTKVIMNKNEFELLNDACDVYRNCRQGQNRFGLLKKCHILLRKYRHRQLMDDLKPWQDELWSEIEKIEKSKVFRIIHDDPKRKYPNQIKAYEAEALNYMDSMKIELDISTDLSNI